MIKAMNNIMAIPARRPFMKVYHSFLHFLGAICGFPLVLLVLRELSVSSETGNTTKGDIPESNTLDVVLFVVVGSVVVGVLVGLHVTLRSLHCQPS